MHYFFWQAQNIRSIWHLFALYAGDTKHLPCHVCSIFPQKKTATSLAAAVICKTDDYDFLSVS